MSGKITIDRYSAKSQILQDGNMPDDGRTTPTTVSSLVCAETAAQTITVSMALGC